MHEASLMAEALRVAEASARQAGASRIHRLHLRVGRLSGVEPQALQLAFEALRPGTLAEGASLRIETVPVVCECTNCGRRFSPADYVFLCPLCGQLACRTLQGQELELVSLEAS
jgi:hydrogenase nickel incorporation protein HypA/HybF